MEKILVLLAIVFLVRSEERFNYTRLMQEYYIICGSDYFCLDSNKTHYYDIHPEYSYSHIELCPKCSCESACVRIGNCCPDLFFALPELQCVNRTIIQRRNDIALDQYVSELMVVTCPPNTDGNLRQKCESQSDIKSRLQHFPVTGLDIPLTYFNQFCAECHNVEDFISWSLDISCLLLADFNFLSTLDEVIRLAYEKLCIFQAYLPRNTFVASRPENCFDKFEEKSFFKKCNETGLWETYDANIIYACESRYLGQYRLFKNMFCYICNPSQHYAMTIVDKCNVTGQWEPYDLGLENSCLYLPQSRATHPYKNIFCFLCNRRNSSNEQFVDLNSRIKEFAISDDKFTYQYNVTISAFNLEYFSFFTKENIEVDNHLGDVVINPFSVDTIRTPTNSVVNLTNLLHQEIALNNRNLDVCNARKTILPPAYGFPCDCRISCLFKVNAKVNGQCCADLAMELHTSCQNSLELTMLERLNKYTYPYGYLVISGCFQEKTFELYIDKCKERREGDIFSTLPINKVGDSIAYNNLYCAICNLESKRYEDKLNGFVDLLDVRNNYSSIENSIDDFNFSHELFDPWDLEFVCPQYLDFSHYLLFGQFLETARSSGCRIQYINSLNKSTACGRRGKYKCSGLQNWTYADKDTEWACNNLVTVYPEFRPIQMHIPNYLSNQLDVSPEKHYRPKKNRVFGNPYCALCEPVLTFSTKFINACNTTGLWEHYDPVLEYRCLNLPQIYYFYPFKNIFCVGCNGISTGSAAFGAPGPPIPSYARIPGVTWFPVLRNLFSVSSDQGQSDTSYYTKCGPSQQYDVYKVSFYHGYKIFFALYEYKPKVWLPMNNNCCSFSTSIFSHCNKDFLFHFVHESFLLLLISQHIPLLINP